MSAAGKWTMTINAGPTSEAVTLVLGDAGSQWTGSMSGPHGSGDLYDVAVDGDQVAFKADITQPFAMTLEFTGSQDGDDLAGSVKLGMFGTGTWSATKD